MNDLPRFGLVNATSSELVLDFVDAFVHVFRAFFRVVSLIQIADLDILWTRPEAWNGNGLESALSKTAVLLSHDNEIADWQ